MEMCACGFNDASVAVEDIEDRVHQGVERIAAVLTSGGITNTVRPSQGRWSNLEYTAHVRDVLPTIRDRLVLGLVEDNPEFKSLYRDERISLGLYRKDTESAVLKELQAAANMFGRLFTGIDSVAHSRLVQYGSPDPAPRTLVWMGKQAVHEVEHHLEDMMENTAQVGG